MRWLGLAALAALSVYFFWLNRHARFASSARRQLERHLSAEQGPDARPRRRRAGAGRVSLWLEKTRVSSRLRERLEDSGLPVRWAVLWRAWLVALVVLPLAACLLARSLAVAPLALAAAFVLPGAALRALARKRKRKTADECDVLAADLSLYLRSGIPVADAVVLCVRDSGPPVSDAVAHFQADLGLGASVDAAFIELATALDNRDLQMIAQAMATSQETGADVSRIMDTIGEAVRERSAIRRELASQTVQGRLSGRVVAALPLIFLGLSALVSRSTLAVLLGTTPGLIILVVAVVLNVLGFLWIKKILDIKG
jgi:tight adherence protein B